ncbi:HAMP domain-containing sensor histidine kinase [Flavobacterium stagni]|uniref:histidine kinase n=1 Tax=Flavobacterium stagni TaxID=2506421 RepID=A0A4Q1KBK3_9FLAO|nr:HAMP domain-containing sensor histidine kinase [Flavobacterium stagni]RXR24247.1 HAMP domain-containing histidine kinase [Flavobacterium stagni]
MIKRPTGTITLFMMPFVTLIGLFSVFIYYTVSSYSESYLFQLLEARAHKVARENLDELSSKRSAPFQSNLSEKLPHEKDYFIPVNAQLNTTVESTKIGVRPEFLTEVIQKGAAEEVTLRYLYKGIVHDTPHGQYIVITAGENFFEKNHTETLFKTLFFTLGAAFLLLLYIAVFYSKNIYKPISSIIEKVKNVGSENLHLRLDETNSNQELNALTQTFNDMLDRIETSFETQNNFISNASHELRTPLTAIIGEADVALAKPRKLEDYVDSLKIILHQAEKLDDKTKALLFLAQTGFSGKTMKFEKVRIDQLLWDVKETLERLNSKNKIFLDTELLPDNPLKLKVNGNVQLLHLAFSNILSNGCKYSDFNTVFLSIGASDDNVYIAIKDTGIGIPENEIKYIYDPFFRASNTKNYEGYGIGLPLTRNIIRMHHGKLVVSSTENEGTLVQITLPSWKPNA